MRRSWKRKLLGGLSLTSALFIFQACYGTPQDLGLDVNIKGKVSSEKTDKPVKGIKVSVVDNMQYAYTDEAGFFSFYIENADTYRLKFVDLDSDQNGSYIPVDTVLTGIDKSIYLNIVLKEK